MKRVIPDILIEQLLLDELDPQTKEELLEEPEVFRRLDLLRASNAEILEEYAPAAMARQIEGRLRAVREGEEIASRERTAGASRKRRRGWLPQLGGLVHRRGFVPAIAAVAAIALVVGIVPFLLHGGMSPAGESGVRIKGAGPVLHVYRETEGGVELLKNGASAAAHDLLQLSYIAAGARYGMIFSIDGSGTVTLHFPEGSRFAARLQSGGEIALPHSYELDNAPRFERFYLVTSSSEFSIGEVLDRARKAASTGNSTPSFPRGFTVTSVTVNKETRR